MDGSRLARKARFLRWALNFYPPYLGAGVRVRHISADLRLVRVKMVLRWYNRNYVGTHFGGNLFAMTDPFWMIMTLRALGNDHVVWDKAAEIEFIRPGRGTVHAEFALDEATLQTIRDATADGAKYLHWFTTDVLDASGEPVARVRKQIYVRLKPEARKNPA